MKKNMNNLKKALLFFSGVTTGIFLNMGLSILNGRVSTVGGEILILPLIGLVLYIGYSFGIDAHEVIDCSHAWYDGYKNEKAEGKVMLEVDMYNKQNAG